MELTLIFLAGVCIGITVSTVIFRAFLVGTLRVDMSEPNDAPYIFLELSKNTDVLHRKKYITLKVNIESYIPHK